MTSPRKIKKETWGRESLPEAERLEVRGATGPIWWGQLFWLPGTDFPICLKFGIWLHLFFPFDPERREWPRSAVGRSRATLAAHSSGPGLGSVRSEWSPHPSGPLCPQQWKGAMMCLLQAEFKHRHGTSLHNMVRFISREQLQAPSTWY